VHELEKKSERGSEGETWSTGRARRLVFVVAEARSAAPHYYCLFLLSFFLLPLLQFIRSVPNLNLGGGPSRERETEVEVYREI
jgi:hypothetical protein